MSWLMRAGVFELLVTLAILGLAYAGLRLHAWWEARKLRRRLPEKPKTLPHQPVEKQTTVNRAMAARRRRG